MLTKSFLFELLENCLIKTSLGPIFLVLVKTERCSKGHDLQTKKKKRVAATILGRVRLGSIRNKNNWNNASKRLFVSNSHSGIPGFHSGYSTPRSRIAGIYSGIHSYSGIFPN